MSEGIFNVPGVLNALLLGSVMMLAIHFSPETALGKDEKLKVGDTAPDFSLPWADQERIVMGIKGRDDQEMISLSQFKGKNVVVLAFYPADWSPGCTTQLCSYRDQFDDFKKLDAVILPISGDYVFSHHFWAIDQKFPFKLLADHDHKVAKLYSSYNADMGFNKRTVFVVGLDGKIAYINWEYKPATEDHYKELIEAVAKAAGKQ